HCVHSARCLRTSHPTPGYGRREDSADAQHAGPPGAGVTLALIARAAAVAGADIAVAAAVHAVDQLVATRLQPVDAADLGRLQAAALRLALGEIAELVVGIELVLELLDAQLDGDGVVEVTEHRHAVGNDVVGV